MFHKNLVIGIPAFAGAVTTVTASDAFSTTSTTATFPLAFPLTGPTWTLITPQFDTDGLGSWTDQATAAVSAAPGASQNVLVRSLPAGTTYTARFRFVLSNGGVDTPITTNTVSATTSASTGTNRAQQYMTASSALVFPVAQKSTTLPTGVQQGAGGNLRFQGTTNASNQSPFVTMLNNGSTQTAYFGKWISPPLTAQTIPSGTYTFKFGGYIESSGPVYNFAPCLYLYRPTTGAVVGSAINDSATGLGTALVYTSTATAGNVFTVSLGSGIPVNDGDVLILEHYAVGSRVTGGAAILHTQFNGATAVTQLGSTSAAAAGVFFPSNISFNESP